MTRLLVLLALALTLAELGSARVWKRCDLARILLQKYKIPRNQLDTWLCIAYRESRYDSHHINVYNTDGSKDYGIFQINNRWWCTNSESPKPNQNLCNVSCDKVLKKMDETVKCIKTMYAKSRNTWEPWITYPYCKKMDMTKFSKGCDLNKPYHHKRGDP